MYFYFRMCAHLTSGFLAYLYALAFLTLNPLVEMDRVYQCDTDDGRQEQETILYAVIRRERIYSRSVIEPRNSNVLAAYIVSPLSLNISLLQVQKFRKS